MSERDRLEELGRFLRDRRGRISPAEVGLPRGARRRVPGLRREEVASLAGIGVTWYTALEHGDATGVSPATLLAVARALRLSASEREYAMELIEHAENAAPSEPPSRIVLETLHAIGVPAYVITPTWKVLACNAAFRRVWEIAEDEIPFNAVERMFLDSRARAMHGDRFAENVTPVIAMLRSSHGRRQHWDALQRLRDRLLEDEAIRTLWDAYEIASPLLSNRVTIVSAVGTLSYETLTLPIPGEPYGIVVQIPDRVV